MYFGDSSILILSIMAGREGLEPSVTVLETAGLAANRTPRRFICF